MFWWHYVLIVFVGVFIIFIVLIWVCFALLIRLTHVYPNIEGIFVHDDLKVRRRILSNVGLVGNEWKIKSIDRSKVKFKVRRIFTSEEMEWKENDYFEMDFPDGKKFILFGMANFDHKVAMKLGTMNNMLNTALAKASLYQQEYMELRSNFDKRVQEELENLKKIMPVIMVKGKGGTK